MHSYWQATRHPWPSLLFVLPLLFLYEGFMLWQAMEGFSPCRAGLDGWIGSALQPQGLTAEYLPSLLIVVICVSWAVLKWDRSCPEGLSTWAGMGIESIVYALALWGLGALVTAGFRDLGIAAKASQAMTYVGCGIFEEVLFRLVLFGTLVLLFKLVTEEKIAVIAAILVSAVGFSTAHFVGPHADPWNLRSFVFRTLAGVVFALLLTTRGLGITVGTHCAYNVLVGLHD